jgi:hypothetical protein
MAAKKDVRIFFSWQSDLPKETTTNAIREAMTLAVNEIEHEIPDIKIFIEEATSNIPGSPDIPATIFDKISLSDIVVSDITTINSSSTDKRKTANPNVLIELGFALSQLGWQRLILLFNEYHGKFPDEVSFDIDRKRIGKFKIISRTDKSGKGNLKSLLIEAIRLILAHNPKKQYEKKVQNPEERKRTLNIANLKRVLRTVNIGMLDRHIEICPSYIDTRILYFYEGFKGTLESSHFFLYDKIADKLLNSLLKSWSDSLSTDVYRDTSDPYIQKFGHVPATGAHLTKKDNEEYEKMAKAIKQLKSTLTKFLNYIRHYYLEIDIDELSRQAYDEWVEFYKD